jgi:hypothetical protein
MPTPEPRNFGHLFWDNGFLSQVKQQVRGGDPALQPAAAKLRRDADASLKIKPLSVMYKTGTPPSGNKHDYMSLSIYYWPNPTSADGRPYVNRDGEINPERNSDYYDAASLSRMISSVGTLSLAYYIFDDDIYGKRAAELLRTWFIDPTTRMNPNLQYAQAVPGKNDGSPSGIIETVRLLELVDAVSFLGPPVWSPFEQEALRSWFRAYLEWLQSSPNGQAEAKAKNNHGTWYDAQVSAYALFIGDTVLPLEILKSSAPARIASQIETDGRQLQEIRRTKSLNYSLYNLEAFISLALLGDHVGVDLWSYSTPDGRSIHKALDFVTPYLTSEKWPYPDISAQPDTGFASYLRRAAIHYQDKNYAYISTNLLGEGANANRLNLLCPTLSEAVMR